MKAVEKKLLEILEPAGLALVLRGALSRAEMVRIANASRVSVAGMRNRAVSVEHLSEALSAKFVPEGPSPGRAPMPLNTAVDRMLPATPSPARERDRRFREEIAQRKFDVNNLKLQLSKSKKERESLEKDVRVLTARLDHAEKKPVTPSEISEKVAATLGETRRLAGAIEKLQGRLREERPAAAASPLARPLEELRREIQELRKAATADRERLARLIEELPARTADAVRPPGASAHEARRGGLERVGVFVDVQNMFYAARGQNARLDFDVLLQTATRGRRLIRAIAYVVEAKEIDQSGFIALLKTKRYEVKRKDLKVRSDGSFKGDWDMEIALDALEMAPSLDRSEEHTSELQSPYDLV